MKSFLLTSFLEVGTARENRRDRLPNTSTLVPNDRSQCLYCVLPMMQCAFGAHLDVGLAERPTRADSLNLFTFLSLIPGKMAVFDKTDSLCIICLVPEFCHGIYD